MSVTKAMEEITWCPGCGNFAILETLVKCMEEMEMSNRNTVLVSGIGQAAKLPHFTNYNMFNGLHGRALPVATGIKLANHGLNVIITSGDGDMYGEGGNHFLHALRRNIGVKVFVHNNQVYGLTKGQASPTSDPGFKTHIQVNGVILNRFNPLALAVSEDCSFVARSTSVKPEHLQDMMAEAVKAKGFALLDILQNCVSFNKRNTFKWYKDRCRELPENYDPADREKAFHTALKWGDEIPIGVIYRSNRKSFEEQTDVLAGAPIVETYCG